MRLENKIGIVTAAVVKLFPKPRSQATAFAALDSPAAAVALLGRLRESCGERITGYELIARVCVDLVLAHVPASRDPLGERHPWYVLVELSDSAEGEGIRRSLQEALEEAAGDGLVRDAALAASEAQRAALWKLREDISEAQKQDGPSIKHDVSVPVSRVPQFIEQADAALEERFPGIRIVAFGHVGDGNIHYNCGKAERQEAEAFFAEAPRVNHVVYDIVTGLGALKREEIKRYKSVLELELMARIKRALDPQGLMNPGKVL